MNRWIMTTAAAAALVAAAQAGAQVTFYEREDFRGSAFSTAQQIDNFARPGFNDRASSVVVERDDWQICQDAGFRGHCVVLRPGRYPSLQALGLNNQVSSVRIVSRSVGADDRYYAPPPPTAAQPVYDARRRDGERLYEANVSSVRAVVGPPEQRCWTERQQVEERSRPNVGGAVIGAVIGGILGHQIGGGSGRDLATAGGAVAGGLTGSNVNRDGGGVVTRDVQRCSEVQAQGQPQYWEVIYVFRGQEHRVQMTSPPGPTVLVNGFGEPRA